MRDRRFAAGGSVELVALGLSLIAPAQAHLMQTGFGASPMDSLTC
jgi:hypothetical protein